MILNDSLTIHLSLTLPLCYGKFRRLKKAKNEKLRKEIKASSKRLEKQFNLEQGLMMERHKTQIEKSQRQSEMMFSSIFKDQFLEKIESTLTYF